MADDPNATLFDGAAAPSTPEPKTQAPVNPDTPASVFTVPDNAQEYIGPGKKYGDVNHALSSIAPAQDHISRLEQENAELREKVAKSLAAEEVLKQIQTAPQAPVTTPPESIDPAVVQNMVISTVEQMNVEQQRKANLVAVDSKMKEMYGTEAADVMATKMAELGVDHSYMADLAANKPNVFLAFFPGKVDKSNVTRSSGSVTPESFNTNTPPAKPKSIMTGASTKDMMNEWDRCGEMVKQEGVV